MSTQIIHETELFQAFSAGIAAIVVSTLALKDGDPDKFVANDKENGDKIFTEAIRQIIGAKTAQEYYQPPTSDQELIPTLQNLAQFILTHLPIKEPK